ncbi:chloride channel protein [Chryseobacterium sp.]|uniref:chloride channel protein n=1 Tax=Chryseobacterium sp. TaxID=1871047 RepID=UPI0011CC2433|nr:chloride channel protein [Chryseobacterium sp.]TXF79001.1 chloride channel protein [Chryseobacterium sp.]
MQRKKIQRHHYWRLMVISAVIALCAALLAFSLKSLTEHFQGQLFNFASRTNSILFIFFPTIGITAIYFLRKYLFRNRRNKGITEIYKTVDQRKEHLPLFKIPSHYFNGFLTVIFGGSTGIEVSTVVATATIGNAAYERNFSAHVYKLELICAGVVAGVAILFGSPVAGWLFAMEVIARKWNRSLLISCTVSAAVSWLFMEYFKSEPLLHFRIWGWNWSALPYFVILSLLGALLSVYFTVLVIRIKNFFSGISSEFIKVNLGALLVGGIIYFFPFLYGDSYHSLTEILTNAHPYSFVFLFLLIILKPLASALTLGAGGDGGVFAPSIVAGAFLGITMALCCNEWFGTSLNLVNFALAGAAATLSASIYAPFTALFLICNLVPNGFALAVPVLMSSLIARFVAPKIFPYNVYTYYMKN